MNNLAIDVIATATAPVATPPGPANQQALEEQPFSEVLAKAEGAKKTSGKVDGSAREEKNGQPASEKVIDDGGQPPRTAPAKDQAEELGEQQVPANATAEATSATPQLANPTSIQAAAAVVTGLQVLGSANSDVGSNNTAAPETSVQAIGPPDQAIRQATKGSPATPMPADGGNAHTPATNAEGGNAHTPATNAGNGNLSPVAGAENMPAERGAAAATASGQVTSEPGGGKTARVVPKQGYESAVQPQAPAQNDEVTMAAQTRTTVENGVGRLERSDRDDQGKADTPMAVAKTGAGEKTTSSAQMVSQAGEASRPAGHAVQANEAPPQTDPRGKSTAPVSLSKGTPAGAEQPNLQVVEQSAARTGAIRPNSESRPDVRFAESTKEGEKPANAPGTNGNAQVDGMPVRFDSKSEAPPATRTQANGHSADIVQQVIRQATLFSHGGKSGLTIQLQPEHLGKLNLKVLSTSDGVAIRVLAESKQAGEILEANVGQLKAAFQERGMPVERVSVQVGPQAEHYGSQARSQTNWGNGGEQRPAPYLTASHPGSEEVKGSRSTSWEEHRLVDVRV